MGIYAWTINDDFTIDTRGNVFLDSLGLTEFPPFVQFGHVGGSFWCNNRLISLRGVPFSVAWFFNCDHNFLESLQYAPSAIGGNFSCIRNSIKFSKEDIKNICRVGGGIYV